MASSMGCGIQLISDYQTLDEQEVGNLREQSKIQEQESKGTYRIAEIVFSVDVSAGIE